MKGLSEGSTLKAGRQRPGKEGNGRGIVVRCALCGAKLYWLPGSYVSVVGLCRTCVYRERDRKNGG